MKIGIIGAGISGLIAGRELSKAGHEVTVIEKSRGFGGRLATGHYGENNKTILDHGIPYFTVESTEFSGFVAELLDQELLKVWGDRFWQYDGEQLLDVVANASASKKFAAVYGMNRIAKYLSRWVDVLQNVKAGGLTYIGPNRGRKRAWMVNLTNFNTFEADAVIIATPAPQAYGILLTTQDEVNIMKIIREIDEIHYEPCIALMAGYGEFEIPEWDAIQCNDPLIRFISNENSKRRDLPETALVAYSTAGFAAENRDRELTRAARIMLERMGKIAGSWAGSPLWNEGHLWKYFRPHNVIRRPYMEHDHQDAPLAVVGDYFEGMDVDHTFRSGLKLARHWIEKFRD